MKTIVLIQARMNSTRLPNKVMLPVGNNITMIEALLLRLSKAKSVDKIVVATTHSASDTPLIKHIQTIGYPTYCGSENNVLDRFYQAALQHKADTVIRITADCPLVDPELLDTMMIEYKTSSVDYMSNVMPPSYPDGLDIEIFSFKALKLAWEHSTSLSEKEHVTPFIQSSNLISRKNFSHKEDFSAHRWTVDEAEDYTVIKNVFDHFSPNIHFSWTDVLALQNDQPQLFTANQSFIRNEGSTTGTGQKLWKRAKKIIPGGNMLLSKRPEMFLPEKWPSYYKSAKGCYIWDMDNIKLTDMSIMGVGTNILGYAHPEVDKAVIQVAQQGNMSSLNCPEEVYLAEKLVELHPWADMVRFARTGGEANAIAIRIARAASGKDNVAVCGYHGWHDWYLAANISKEGSLDSHLLPGLAPNGVPNDLKNSTFTFHYNNFNELKSLVAEHDIGIIKMEVQRSAPPQDDFLLKVRQLSTDKGIILIFDECTSGFRETDGGLHKKFNVDPDMAVFGKALGNGYAITSVLGKRAIMEAAQSSFISSTFWTERIGPTAALKTIEIMQREQSWLTITKTGLNIRQQWQTLADEFNLKIEHWGLPSLTGFNFSNQHAAYKSLITQEMLKKGFLAGNCIYVSIAHTESIIEQYFSALKPIFKTIAQCEDGLEVMSLLDGPVCHSGFKRLN